MTLSPRTEAAIDNLTAHMRELARLREENAELLLLLSALIGPERYGEGAGAKGRFPSYLSWDDVRNARAAIAKAEAAAVSNDPTGI